MFLNYGLWVVCAAITNFYVVFVENLVVLVIFRKIFTDEVQKLSAETTNRYPIRKYIAQNRRVLKVTKITENSLRYNLLSS